MLRAFGLRIPSLPSSPARSGRQMRIGYNQSWITLARAFAGGAARRKGADRGSGSCVAFDGTDRPRSRHRAADGKSPPPSGHTSEPPAGQPRFRVPENLFSHAGHAVPASARPAASRIVAEPAMPDHPGRLARVAADWNHRRRSGAALIRSDKRSRAFSAWLKTL